MYFEHKISEKGIESDESKVKMIWEWHTPKSIIEVRSVLGFTNYYPWFIYRCAQGIQPLYQLISGENTSKENKTTEWHGECEEAFRKLKESCTPMPIPAHADFFQTIQITYQCVYFGIGRNPISKSGWG